MKHLFLQKVSTATQADLASNGKFFVVVGVIALVFLGISGFLIYIDKRLKKLEDKA
ncbi:MAG: CcmD family protein [Bacteroidia bacterium]|nr:CcmD family protein [Bacteroidia bacterium]